jgi:hypothetical protein
MPDLRVRGRRRDNRGPKYIGVLHAHLPRGGTDGIALEPHLLPDGRNVLVRRWVRLCCFRPGPASAAGPPPFITR